MIMKIGQDGKKGLGLVNYIRKENKEISHSNPDTQKGLQIIPLIVSILVLVLVMPALCADQEGNGIKVYFNGDLKGSTAYIDSSSGVCMVPLALIESLPGLRLDVRDNQAWFALNGRQLTTTMGSTAYTVDGQSKLWRCGLQPWQYGIAVPGRDLMEALGAAVRWDTKERAMYITAPVPSPTAPKNLCPTNQPLHLAFLQDEQLWIMDASQPGSQPWLVPSCNMEKIIGWSQDGKWLAYTQRLSDDKYSGDQSLWVVSYDGQQPQCLDKLLIAYDNPVWSPTDNTIAYHVQLREHSDLDNKSLRIAYQEKGKWQNRELLKSVDRTMGSGLTWFPDGQSLAVSWVHDKKNLPEIDRVDLKGKNSCLFVLPTSLAGNYEDGMYTRDISGLKLSPDERYVACFLGMNSGSINADGMDLELIDLQQKTCYEVGCALGYPEWVTWSADSQKLAAILGYDRTASMGKHLQLVQIDKNGFKAQNMGETGQVDSRPIWSKDGQTLYFTRGKESVDWLEKGRHQEVQVPGQQIFCRKGNQPVSLSTPGEQQGDYPLSLSPDGQYMVIQRLNFVDMGTLYLMNLTNGQMIKLMDDVQANAGYYGNYYPDQVSIHWNNK